ncbi:four helix bundle protein [Autumnicola edwardsiae]|uniref:Four helix bundle protein n=1 Tax=Autumnicola edwardsiae TaxID=3075594 RepID=A0ABU3CUY0_9FLAO|nr:four helix bundle protein [Zunongwangia sp. F297]MDT0650150.1 four helix bundle protein [Zunongwangia sp. F297]
MLRDLKLCSKDFAHLCVKIALSLPESALGRHTKHQLIRSSTSVAANYRAASLGQSKKAFISKLSIVIEEADECVFWMEFLKEEGLATGMTFESALKEGRELTAIFVSSRRTAEKTNKRE